MGCLKLSYTAPGALEQNATFLRVSPGKSVSDEKLCTDYYPFGMVARRENTPNAYFEAPSDTAKQNFGQYYRYGFQGQFSEEDSETGWNSFEARMYDPIIARWLVPDPARQYWSPYMAMGNNPINRLDPDGRTDNPFGASQYDANFEGIQTGGYSAYFPTLDHFWSIGPDGIQTITFLDELEFFAVNAPVAHARDGITPTIQYFATGAPLIKVYDQQFGFLLMGGDPTANNDPLGTTNVKRTEVLENFSLGFPAGKKPSNHYDRSKDLADGATRIATLFERLFGGSNKPQLQREVSGDTLFFLNEHGERHGNYVIKDYQGLGAGWHKGYRVNGGDTSEVQIWNGVFPSN